MNTCAYWHAKRSSSRCCQKCLNFRFARFSFLHSGTRRTYISTLAPNMCNAHAIRISFADWCFSFFVWVRLQRNEASASRVIYRWQWFWILWKSNHDRSISFAVRIFVGKRSAYNGTEPPMGMRAPTFWRSYISAFTILVAWKWHRAHRCPMPRKII